MPQINTFSIAQEAAARHADPTPVVYVVDGDPGDRAELQELIARAGLHTLLFASAEDFAPRECTKTASCILIDVSRPGRCGLRLQQVISETRPDISVIFFTDHCDVSVTVQAMKAGAVNFLAKPLIQEVVLGAIQCGLERSRSVLSVAAETRALEERYASLSRRERQIIAMVASGLMNKEIGSKLGISEVTVKAHRGRVMQKMNARSVVDLVNIATQLSKTTTKTWEMKE